MVVITEILKSIGYFLGLTFRTDVLWNVVPLIFATILVIFYFERYKDERPGWSAYLTNTLVLIFVSMALFRHIHGLSVDGFYNFVDYPDKTIVTAFVLLVGGLLMKFNFEHILPEKYTGYISSPLTINLMAYAAILFVFSSVKMSWIVFFALVLIVLLLSAILILIKIPLKKLIKLIKKEKKKERMKSLKEERHQIKELKGQLRYMEKEKKAIELRQLNEQKKEAIKLKKVIKK
tara:strand:+ start:594 stop:1295 length:702 start_codon:yes stop_codon:yes gene_type:complete